jgi:hypothetical protein
LFERSPVSKARNNTLMGSAWRAHERVHVFFLCAWHRFFYLPLTTETKQFVVTMVAKSSYYSAVLLCPFASTYQPTRTTKMHCRQVDDFDFIPVRFQQGFSLGMPVFVQETQKGCSRHTGFHSQSIAWIAWSWHLCWSACNFGCLNACGTQPVAYHQATV